MLHAHPFASCRIRPKVHKSTSPQVPGPCGTIFFGACSKLHLGSAGCMSAMICDSKADDTRLLSDLGKLIQTPVCPNSVQLQPRSGTFAASQWLPEPAEATQQVEDTKARKLYLQELQVMLNQHAASHIKKYCSTFCLFMIMQCFTICFTMFYYLFLHDQRTFPHKKRCLSEVTQLDDSIKELATRAKLHHQIDLHLILSRISTQNPKLLYPPLDFH